VVFEHKSVGPGTALNSRFFVALSPTGGDTELAVFDYSGEIAINSGHSKQRLSTFSPMEHYCWVSKWARHFSQALKLYSPFRLSASFMEIS
jgi:hypothetical protein